MDDITMLKLSPVAESMCLRLQDFEAVSTEGTIHVPRILIREYTYHTSEPTFLYEMNDFKHCMLDAFTHLYKCAPFSGVWN